MSTDARCHVCGPSRTLWTARGGTSGGDAAWCGTSCGDAAWCGTSSGNAAWCGTSCGDAAWCGAACDSTACHGVGSGPVPCADLHAQFDLQARSMYGGALRHHAKFPGDSEEMSSGLQPGVGPVEVSGAIMTAGVLRLDQMLEHIQVGGFDASSQSVTHLLRESAHLGDDPTEQVACEDHGGGLTGTMPLAHADRALTYRRWNDRRQARGRRRGRGADGNDGSNGSGGSDGSNGSGGSATGGGSRGGHGGRGWRRVYRDIGASRCTQRRCALMTHQRDSLSDVIDQRSQGPHRTGNRGASSQRCQPVDWVTTEHPVVRVEPNSTMERERATWLIQWGTP